MEPFYVTLEPVGEDEQPHGAESRVEYLDDEVLDDLRLSPHPFERAHPSD